MLGCSSQGWQVTKCQLSLDKAAHVAWPPARGPALQATTCPLTLAGNSSPVPLRRAWGAVGWWCRGRGCTVLRSAGRGTAGTTTVTLGTLTAPMVLTVLPALLPKSECPPVLAPAHRTGTGCCRDVPHPQSPAPQPRQVPQERSLSAEHHPAELWPLRGIKLCGAPKVPLAPQQRCHTQ